MSRRHPSRLGRHLVHNLHPADIPAQRRSTVVGGGYYAAYVVNATESAESGCPGGLRVDGWANINNLTSADGIFTLMVP